jgi:hypothetical protein
MCDELGERARAHRVGSEAGFIKIVFDGEACHAFIDNAASECRGETAKEGTVVMGGVLRHS